MDEFYSYDLAFMLNQIYTFEYGLVVAARRDNSNCIILFRNASSSNPFSWSVKRDIKNLMKKCLYFSIFLDINITIFKNILSIINKAVPYCMHFLEFDLYNLYFQILKILYFSYTTFLISVDKNYCFIKSELKNIFCKYSIFNY